MFNLKIITFFLLLFNQYKFLWSAASSSSAAGSIVTASALEGEVAKQRSAEDEELDLRLRFVTIRILQPAYIDLCNSKKTSLGRWYYKGVSKKREESSFFAKSRKVMNWLKSYPQELTIQSQLMYAFKLRDVSQQKKEFEIDEAIKRLYVNPFALQYFCLNTKKWLWLNHVQKEGCVHLYAIKEKVGQRINQLILTPRKVQVGLEMCDKIYFFLK